jgi:hypothetical protein
MAATPEFKEAATEALVQAKKYSMERPPEFDAWVDALRLEASAEGPDENFDPASILVDMLNAATYEEAEARQSTSLMSAKNDMLDIPHVISGFKLRISDDKYTKKNDRSLGVFAIVTATRSDNDNPVTYGVGAANVIAVLWMARKFGKIPGEFTIYGRETDNGLLLFMRRLGA